MSCIVSPIFLQDIVKTMFIGENISTQVIIVLNNKSWLIIAKEFQQRMKLTPIKHLRVYSLLLERSHGLPACGVIKNLFVDLCSTTTCLLRTIGLLTITII